MQVHTLRGYIQNIFLVEYAHGCLLLDGACRADFETIETFFKDTLKRPLSDLKIVMVTHMHPDHAGCAHYLREVSGCQIISGQFESQWYSGIRGKLNHAIDIYLAHWVAKRLGIKRRSLWYSPALKPDMMLADGETLPSFSDWKLIATPGHTHMDVSLLNEQHALLYVADLVVKVKGQFNPPFPVSLPQQYKQSVAKLRDYVHCDIMMAHVPSQRMNEDDITHVLSLTPERPQNNYQMLLSMAKKLARFKN